METELLIQKGLKTNPKKTFQTLNT